MVTHLHIITPGQRRRTLKIPHKLVVKKLGGKNTCYSHVVGFTNGVTKINLGHQFRHCRCI